MTNAKRMVGISRGNRKPDAAMQLSWNKLMHSYQTRHNSIKTCSTGLICAEDNHGGGSIQSHYSDTGNHWVPNTYLH